MVHDFNDKRESVPEVRVEFLKSDREKMKELFQHAKALHGELPKRLGSKGQTTADLAGVRGKELNGVDVEVLRALHTMSPIELQREFDDLESQADRHPAQISVKSGLLSGAKRVVETPGFLRTSFLTDKDSVAEVIGIADLEEHIRQGGTTRGFQENIKLGNKYQAQTKEFVQIDGKGSPVLSFEEIVDSRQAEFQRGHRRITRYFKQKNGTEIQVQHTLPYDGQEVTTEVDFYNPKYRKTLARRVVRYDGTGENYESEFNTTDFKGDKRRALIFHYEGGLKTGETIKTSLGSGASAEYLYEGADGQKIYRKVEEDGGYQDFDL